MLKDEDRIFQNLYNDRGSDVESSRKRGDWTNTKELIEKGRAVVKFEDLQVHLEVEKCRTVDKFERSKSNIKTLKTLRSIVLRGLLEN